MEQNFIEYLETVFGKKPSKCENKFDPTDFKVVQQASVDTNLRRISSSSNSISRDSSMGSSNSNSISSSSIGSIGRDSSMGSSNSNSISSSSIGSIGRDSSSSIDSSDSIFILNEQQTNRLEEEKNLLERKLEAMKQTQNNLRKQNERLKSKQQPVRSSSPSSSFAHGSTNQYVNKIANLQAQIELLRSSNNANLKTVDADDKDRIIYDYYLDRLARRAKETDDQIMTKIHSIMVTLKDENNLILVDKEPEQFYSQVKKRIEENEGKTKAILDFLGYQDGSLIPVKDFNDTSKEYRIESMKGKEGIVDYTIKGGSEYATFSEAMQIEIENTTKPFFENIDDESLMKFLSYIVEITAEPSRQYHSTSSSSSPPESQVRLNQDTDITEFVKQLLSNIDKGVEKSSPDSQFAVGDYRSTPTTFLVNLFKAHKDFDEIIPKYYSIKDVSWKAFNTGNQGAIITFCLKIITFFKKDEHSFQETIDSVATFTRLFRESLFENMMKNSYPIDFVNIQRNQAASQWKDNQFVQRVMLIAALVEKKDVMNPDMQKEYETEIEGDEEAKKSYNEFKAKNLPDVPKYIRRIYCSAMLVYYSPSFRNESNLPYDDIIANFVENKDQNFSSDVLETINKRINEKENFQEKIREKLSGDQLQPNYVFPNNEVKSIIDDILSTTENIKIITQNLVNRTPAGFPMNFSLDNNTREEKIFHIILYIYFQYTFVGEQIKAAIPNETKERKERTINDLKIRSGYLLDNQIMDMMYLKFRGKPRETISNTQRKGNQEGKVKRSNHPDLKKFFVLLSSTRDRDYVTEQMQRKNIDPENLENPDQMISKGPESVIYMNTDSNNKPTSFSRSANPFTGIKLKKVKKNEGGDSGGLPSGGGGGILDEIKKGVRLKVFKQGEKTSSSSTSSDQRPTLSHLDEINALRKG